MIDEAFRITYTDEALRHIRKIEARHHTFIQRVIDQQLRYQPTTKTRNRKPLIESQRFVDETWEIRFGENNCFRVFYQVDYSGRCVSVVAIARKENNRFYVGDEVFVP